MSDGNGDARAITMDWKVSIGLLVLLVGWVFSLGLSYATLMSVRDGLASHVNAGQHVATTQALSSMQTEIANSTAIMQRDIATLTVTVRQLKEDIQKLERKLD